MLPSVVLVEAVLTPVLPFNKACELQLVAAASATTAGRCPCLQETLQIFGPTNWTEWADATGSYLLKQRPPQECVAPGNECNRSTFRLS